MIIHKGSVSIATPSSSCLTNTTIIFFLKHSPDSFIVTQIIDHRPTESVFAVFYLNTLYFDPYIVRPAAAFS